jgi:hypothetical protein
MPSGRRTAGSNGETERGSEAGNGAGGSPGSAGAGAADGGFWFKGSGERFLEDLPP